MKKNVCLVSLGCDKNLMDSEVMLGLLAEKGWRLTADKDAADILILNTCGFIKDAVDESFAHAKDLAARRKNGGCRALIITGCMAQRYRDEIFRAIPEADAVLGTGDYEGILAAVEAAAAGEKTLAVSDINNDISEEARLKRVVSTPSHFAYIKIAEGCNNRCTYCTIPSLRGGYRSRPMESLIKEAETLAARGVKELVVVAQDTSLYGRDLYGEMRIDRLLNAFSKIDGIAWIRLLYCYPEHITPGLIAEMAANPKILNYIDMPIQHADD
ncbi:MAG: MiaB/RimO family radical SAM methylthiotransferase, partial [Clostridiales bacterium]|nr:MiaB/RimO family radical SAM methylthiotransferase [Clostridiales bacterium]